MDPKILRSLSQLGVILVMIFSIYYAYINWAKGTPKWNFLILGFGIALLLSVNLLVKRKD